MAMDAVVKEYGMLFTAIVGALLGFGLIVISVLHFKDNSRQMIADMTGAQYEDTQYEK